MNSSKESRQAAGKVLAVTGITGHSGGFFLEELEKRDYPGIVRCLVRETSNTVALDRSRLSIEKYIGDVTKYEDLLRLTSGADTVMHISNIHQSLDVLRASMQNRVRRVVLVHTTGVYSKHKMASGEYKEIEAEIDKLLLSADLDVTILRPTMIFGDMCDHNIHKFIRMVDKLPVMPEIDHGSGRIRPVNARDLGRAYYQVCMASHLPNLKYDVSGESSLTLHELFDLIGEELGKTVRHISCPMWLGSTGARAVKTLSLGRVDLVEKVLRMGEDRDYVHDAATRDFGYEPEPFRVGLRREVQQYMRERK